MLHHQTALLKLPREHYNRITYACRHPVGWVTDLHALRRLDPVQGFADEGMVQEIRHARRRLAAAGFRAIQTGSIEEVIGPLSDYRPHLIALCSRLDVPTARTLAEVKEPARDGSSEREARVPFGPVYSCWDGTYRKPMMPKTQCSSTAELTTTLFQRFDAGQPRAREVER